VHGLCMVLMAVSALRMLVITSPGPRGWTKLGWLGPVTQAAGIILSAGTSGSPSGRTADDRILLQWARVSLSHAAAEQCQAKGDIDAITAGRSRGYS
jgi:hypothetical protein